MTLVEFVPPVPHPLWTLCRQMGITDVIVKVNPALTGLPDPWRLATLKSIVGRLADAGLRVVGLEGDPFDMSPIKEWEGRASSRPRVPPVSRDTALAHYCELLESMAALDIRLLCYNFMPGTGWARTGVRAGRGGALATYFSLKEVETGLGTTGEVHSNPKAENPVIPVKEHLLLSHGQVWANYEHFIRAVMPTAARCGVRMALHPDDPCLPSLGGYARIFGSVASYDRAYALYPSPSNAVTFCQANFKLMADATSASLPADATSASLPADATTYDPPGATERLIRMIRHFGDRIAFIHVRDVEGTREDFTELFHDQGDTDQFALMRTYRALGLDVPVRGDHVPEMAGDRLLAPDAVPGYSTLGRLFANGYLKALLKGTGNET